LIGSSAFTRNRTPSVLTRAVLGMVGWKWIVLAPEVSENDVRGDRELGTPQLYNAFEIFNHGR